MAKSIFVSFASQNINWTNNLRLWERDGLLGESIKLTFERGDKRPKGKDAVFREINAMIQGATAVLFIVGDVSAQRMWVDYEVEVTLKKHKKIIIARIPDTTGAAPKRLKELIQLNKIKEITCDPTSIKKAIQLL